MEASENLHRHRNDEPNQPALPLFPSSRLKLDTWKEDQTYQAEAKVGSAAAAEVGGERRGESVIVTLVSIAGKGIDPLVV